MSFKEKFVNKNENFKKSIKLAIIGVCILAVTGLVWILIFSKYYEFSKNEKKFLDEVKDFYNFRPELLPKNGQTREITLEKMFLENRIEDLYVPNSNKLCDTDSWVKVYNNYGKYEYYVYLKCGKYESKIDHKGPEVVLNGDSEITVDYGSEYKELGVKSVKDNKDGEIDVDKVVIDSSKVNTNETGVYKVTYKVSDKLNNQTKVERTVYVNKNLTQLVREATDDSNYYKGEAENNFLQFSGMLFRIVNANEDGSIKIVTNDNVSNLKYGEQEVDFDDSNIKDWLNNYFYDYIYDKSYLKENNKWCIDEMNTPTDSCNTLSKEYPVGMLSIGDYLKSFDKTSYLNTTSEYWFLNKYDYKTGNTHLSSKENGFNTMYCDSITGVRPVLVLKENLHITSGDGTVDNPYKLNDYKYGKTGDLLNSRLAGEYVTYSGMIFRIVEPDKDNNTKLISVDFLTNNTTTNYLYSKYENGKCRVNPNEEGNIAYKLNNDYIDYISDKYIINHEFEYPIVKFGEKYSDYKMKSYKAKLGIPYSYELFSGSNMMVGQINYWLSDYVNDDNAYMVNNGNGRTFNVYLGKMYDSNGFKITVYLSSKVKIKSGNGTIHNAYTIE